MGRNKKEPTQRELRRKKERAATKRLTPEQYDLLRASVVDREVEAKVDQVMAAMSAHMITALRMNRIGAERIKKITMDIRDLCIKDVEGDA